MISLTFLTAFKTPFPKKRFSLLSRNSKVSYLPFDVPDGTEARPSILFSVITSTSTVGFPLESNICLA